MEQITPVDRRKVISVMGYISTETNIMELIDEALLKQLGIC